MDEPSDSGIEEAVVKTYDDDRELRRGPVFSRVDPFRPAATRSFYVR